MEVSQGKRRLILGVLLSATLVATVWVDQQDEELPEVVTLAAVESVANHSQTTSTSKQLELNLEILQSRIALKETDKDPEINTDLFAAKSWNSAPPLPTPQISSAVSIKKTPNPITPVAPHLPFSYMGKMERDGNLIIYLSAGESAYSVGIGDTIEDAYRVEKIETGQVIFTYLPTAITQTLKIGS